MSMYHPKLAELVRQDPRYAYEAYEFIFAALAHTQKMLGRLPREPSSPQGEPNHHVTGPELLQGLRDLARVDSLLVPDYLTMLDRRVELFQFATNHQLGGE